MTWSHTSLTLVTRFFCTSSDLSVTSVDGVVPLAFDLIGQFYCDVLAVSCRTFQTVKRNTWTHSLK